MSLERLGGFSFVGRQSERSSAHEVSDGVGDQEDCTPHDERDTKQPEARRGVGVDPLSDSHDCCLSISVRRGGLYETERITPPMHIASEGLSQATVRLLSLRTRSPGIPCSYGSYYP